MLTFDPIDELKRKSFRKTAGIAGAFALVAPSYYGLDFAEPEPKRNSRKKRAMRKAIKLRRKQKHRK